MIKIRSERGFSLLEVILAITILAIIIIPMTGFIENTIRLIKKTELQEKALIMGQQRMEQLKTVPYDKLEREAGRDKLADFDYLSLNIKNNQGFIRKVKINKLPFINNMKEIVVEVAWAQGKQKIILTTRVTER